jgi:Tol biopolymer transport system component
LDRFEKQIEIHDVASGKSQTILSGSGLGDEIAWLASGRLIYSLREEERAADDYNLWWVQLDAHTLMASSPPARITNDRGHTARISVEDDGKHMALLRSASQSDVYLADIEEQGRRLSKPRRFTLDDRADYASDWTPDNKAVLFISDRDGSFHLFRQLLDQTQPELMVGGNQDIGPPQLSPEGRSVVYSVPWQPTKPLESIRIMQLPLTGGPSQLVLEEPGITAYQCTRHPLAFCVYSRIDNGIETFFSFTLAGGKGKEIVAARRKCEGGPGCNWALSPNGRYLAYPDSPYDGTASDVRLLELASGAERKVSLPGMGLIMGLNWLTDGEAVLVGGYMGRNAGGTRSGLMTVDLNGKVRTLLAGPYPAILWAIPSRDGRRVAIAASTQSSNVWLLENF